MDFYILTETLTHHPSSTFLKLLSQSLLDLQDFFDKYLRNMENTSDGHSLFFTSSLLGIIHLRSSNSCDNSYFFVPELCKLLRFGEAYVCYDFHSLCKLVSSLVP